MPLESKLDILTNESLAQHTTFGIGGPALYFVCPKTVDDLVLLNDFARETDLALYILGNGSNVLFSEKGFPGIVVSMKSFVEQLERINETMIVASAGCMLYTCARFCATHGLGGLEDLAWIPATVGGAIMQNASAHKTAIGDRIHTVDIYSLKDNVVYTRKASELEFSYRKSEGIDGILVRAVLACEPAREEEIMAAISERGAYRKKYQDVGYPSAGCIFKNPTNSELSAGAMIDACGLKGLTHGQAQISLVHANFIVNKGRASAEDVRFLIEEARAAVKSKFDICLEEEIEYVE